MAESPTCATCPILRPDTDPRLPHRPPVCDGDRRLIDRYFTDIANLTADLSNPEPPVVDQRQHERFGTVYLKGGARHVFSRGLHPCDPLAPLGGVAPINSKSKAPTVSGSRERPIPINAAVLDLNGPAKVPSLAPSVRGHGQPATGWPEDQIGFLSAATVLDQWVRDVRDLLFPDHHLPPATVDEMVSWLRLRLDDICDRYPAVADMTDEVRHLRGALRQAAGETEARPEHCDAIPCKRCDLIMLYRQPDGDVECVNPDCRAIYRPDEYQEWIKTLLVENTIKRHAGSDT